MKRNHNWYSNTNLDTTSFWWLLRMTGKVHNEPWPEEHSILVLQVKTHEMNIHERRHQDQTMGRDYQTLQIREYNCTACKSRIGLAGTRNKHGCPSGPRGYVKAVMCSHSRVRVPLRAFFYPRGSISLFHSFSSQFHHLRETDLSWYHESEQESQGFGCAFSFDC